MSAKRILTVILAVMAGCVVANYFWNQHPAVKNSMPQNVALKSILPTVPEKIAQVPLTPEQTPVIVSPPAESPAKLPKQKAGKPAAQKPPIQDPDARTALSLVGVDPAAEAYWASAINDPNLPPEERKDLIEDLNEDGLSDPQHPGPQDLPMILNRIQIIQEMAPDSMDQVNADAFQ